MEERSEPEGPAQRLQRQGSRQLSPLISASGRTLLDIIRDEDASGSRAPSSARWKGFKDHLRLQRAGAAWAESSVRGHALLGSRPSLARSLAVRPGPPTEASRSATVSEYSPAAEAADAHEQASAASTEGKQQQEEEPVTISLMALLEQADRERGHTETEEKEEEGGKGEGPMEKEGEEEGEGGEGGEMYVCCVCMVRHRGAAFIPCGHTFCRLCSRELWVNRGNCPLCNGFIREILDIF